MTNRELAAKYLAKIKEEDDNKINAFCKTCFTEKVMTDLGSYSVRDFREVGKVISASLDKYFSITKDKLNVIRNDNSESEAASPEDFSEETGVPNDQSVDFVTASSVQSHPQFSLNYDQM